VAAIPQEIVSSSGAVLAERHDKGVPPGLAKKGGVPPGAR
jgi:hypothetical protein